MNDNITKKDKPKTHKSTVIEATNPATDDTDDEEQLPDLISGDYSERDYGYMSEDTSDEEDSGYSAGDNGSLSKEGVAPAPPSAPVPALPTLAELTAKLLMVEANQPRGNDKAFYTSINKSTYSEEQPTCYYCKRKGHIMRDCYKFKADKEVPNNMRIDSGATRHVYYL
jgi:hypothetical protein